MRRRGTAGLLLLLFLLGLLSGCGQQEEGDGQDGLEQELIQVGVIQVGAESDWRVANSESVKGVFTEENGYELLFTDARQKQENQIIAIRRLIQQRVDYMILMPIEEAGWDSVLQEAQDAGIPVIVADRKVAVEDDGLFAAWVGSDFQGDGARAVAWIAQRFGDQPVNILHIQGTLGSTAQLGRTAALEQGVAEHDQWQILAQLNGDFTRAKTYETMKEYLRENHPDIQVAYCENDSEAFGAIQALEEEGYTVGGETGVQVISFDGTRSGLEACLGGKIALDLEYNPLLGEELRAVVEQLEAGETPQKYTYLQGRAFTADNLTAELIAQRPY